MGEPLTEQEIAVLKEAAQNLLAMDRVRRLFTTGLIWFAGIITAAGVLWNFMPHFWNKGP